MTPAHPAMTVEQAVRERCLELALQYDSMGGATDTARRWADFVLGKRDAEIIGAAQELAEKVRS